VPTYQYACTACNHRFEAVQAFTDDSLTVCPECGGSLRKVYGSVGVVFKGSGFYRTDSRSGAVSPAPSGSEKSGSGEKSGEKSGGDKAGGEKKAAAASSSDSSSSSSAAKSGAGSSSGSGSSGSSSSGGSKAAAS
jgi:putative FmdB family regulatory protein